MMLILYIHVATYYATFDKNALILTAYSSTASYHTRTLLQDKE